MRVTLQAPPWGATQPTSELLDAVSLMADDLWSETALRFYADRAAKLHNSRRAPKGMQAELNKVIAEHFIADGWIGGDGRFAKGRTWIRITFRHQMSLGSDLIDAMKMCKKEHYELAVIMAADGATLRLISPNDAAALTSFEKLRIAIADLEGVTDIPLLIGCLTPQSAPSANVTRALREDRPRDVTVPFSQVEDDSPVGDE